MVINNLFKVIDDQLLILSEARRQGRYKWFDFVSALKSLNDRIQDEGYNEYRIRKVSRLVNVFNDLCQTIVQSYSCRVLAYDKERKIATTEWHLLGEDCQVKTIEEPVISGLEEYYEQLSLPERELHSGDHLKTTKIKYLLRGCTEDFEELASVYYPDSDEMDDSLKSLKAEWSAFALRHYQLLNERRADFNEIFKIDSSTIRKYRITFDEYIKELKAERLIIQRSNKTDEVQTQRDNQLKIPCLLNLALKQSQLLYDRLTKYGKFLPQDTNKEHFNYIFSGGAQPDNFKPLKWMVAKQSLYELLRLLSSRVSNQQRKDAGILFTNDKNSAIGTLNVPKSTEYSRYYNELENIVKGINPYTPTD